MKKFFGFLLLLFSLPLAAQQKFTVSGTVKDSASGESIIGAIVSIKSIPAGTATNTYGFYSLTVPAGNDSLTVSFTGYQTKTIAIDLNKDQQLNVELSIQNLQEVTISGEKADKNVSSTTMSSQHLDMKQVRSLPVLFGEVDIMKTIALLPGVLSVGEGNTGIYVRGGSADQNLILLDEATVYNPSHLLGFFSVFNSDAIKDVNVIKGGIPAEYGGRLSSVIDVRMDDGNAKTFSVKGGIGLIASRLTFEGPIVKNKGSFIVSGRRTYADLLFRGLSSDPTVKKSQLYFYDFNVKANYEFNNNNRVFLSGYFGRDALGISGRLGINYGNATGTLRWNHIFNDKLFLNTSLITSNYNYVINVTAGNNNFGITSSIRDYALKESFEYYLNSKNEIKFGINSIYHVFSPGNVTTNGTSIIHDLSIERKYAMENAIYISNEQTLTARLTVNYGLRYSMFMLLGPSKIFAYDSDGNVTDTSAYSSGKIIKTYGVLEPRASARFTIDENSSIKASYCRTSQFVQLLSNTTSSTPTDLWVPSSTIIKPEIGDQEAIGYFRNFLHDKIETSVEVYYKTMQNQVDYKPGADLVLNPLVESQLYFGKGRAYGVEFYVNKRVGKFTGWVSYTLSRTERQVNQINGGSWYPATQDRTHDISVVGTYDLNSRWTFGAVFVYATGNAVTFPVAQYQYQGNVVTYYTGQNGYRMPSYNRLDISATYHVKTKKKLESNWNFSIYNVYDRHNAYSIDFQQDPNNPAQTQAVMTWLFGIIPSVTYNFNF